MSVRTPAPQSAAQIILSAVKAATSTNFKLKDAYNLLAQVHGFKDWATAKPHLEARLANAPLVFGQPYRVIAGWQTIVVTEDRPNDEEEVFMYPLGTTLENHAATRYSGEVLRDPGVELQLLTEFLPSMSRAELAQNVVVRNVWSLLPRVDKYSIPNFAVEALAGPFFAEWFGWGYAHLAGENDEELSNSSLAAVECSIIESGDDGGARWWAELAISPALASKLDAVCQSRGYVFNKT